MSTVRRFPVGMGNVRWGHFRMVGPSRYGGPRVILFDDVVPGPRNRCGADARRTFGLEIVQAPSNTQSPNGFAERAVRSLKVSAGNIAPVESRPEIEHRILAMAVVSKNHSPHTTAGLPHETEMSGRSYILSGFAQSAFNRNPDSTGPAIKQMNAARNIANARNAAIRADDNRVVRAFIRSLKDRSVVFCPIDGSVQSAYKRRWIWAFRAHARLGSNLIPEKAGRILIRPKFK